jgi:hypothetical protein
MSPNVADTLLERHLRNTAFAFVTAPAPTDTTPKYVAGSNLMTSYKNYTELRPGFGTGLESTPTTFTDPIVRTFCWRRWGGLFYAMLCTSGTVAKVWKLAIGQDASFVLIWTSTAPEPFDFVVSNNFCFFGNGVDMRKFDGVTVTKWGIAAPNSAISGPTAPTVAADTAVPGGAAWTNPNNILLNDGNFATATCATNSNPTDLLKGTTFGFAIPATATIQGIQVDIKGLQTHTGLGDTIPNSSVQLLKAGVLTGNIEYQTFPRGAPNAFVTFGGSTDLWGAVWSAADLNGANFGAAFQGFFSKAATSWSIDFMRITIFFSDASVGAPTTGVSGTGITASTGWQYVYCYMNSSTGHVSSPSPPSTSTGPVANKTVNVTVIASTDPQVDKIRIFRTTDGGGGIFFEIAGGPFANASATYPDTTTDANLSLITAPTFGFNDPPPNMKGMVWFANRIWGFNNASLFFTDWEEMNIGVPEEGSVSGLAGNFWNFSSEITGLSVAQDGVIIFCAGHIYKIDGDSLDTFRRTVIADGLGCRNRATITRLGGLTAFLANTNSVWTTDSTSLTEISQGIQPTLDNIDHSQASMAFHLQGQYRWLLLCDQGHSQTLPFDVNNQQWMVPWSIVGQGISSGETSQGNWTLLLGQQTTNKMLQMTPNVYADNGVTYSASGTMNLVPLVNEHLSSGSPIIDLFYPQAPGHVSYLEYVGMDTNAVLPTSVKFLADDDPATGVYTDITANIENAPLKAQGTNVVDKWYYARKPTMKRVSIQMNWAGGQNFKLYTLSMAYRIYR